MPFPTMDPKWFWTSPVDFGRVQIIKISPEKCYLNPQQNALDPTKTIKTQLLMKQIHPSKTILMVQNKFWLIEGH